jgi:hypothetical protein
LQAVLRTYFTQDFRDFFFEGEKALGRMWPEFLVPASADLDELYAFPL